MDNGKHLPTIEHFSKIDNYCFPVSSSAVRRTSLDELETPHFSRIGIPVWIFLADIADDLI